MSNEDQISEESTKLKVEIAKVLGLQLEYRSGFRDDGEFYYIFSFVGRSFPSLNSSRTEEEAWEKAADIVLTPVIRQICEHLDAEYNQDWE